MSNTFKKKYTKCVFCQYFIKVLAPTCRRDDAGSSHFLCDASLFVFSCYRQLDLLGQSVFNFVHPCDQEELRDLLTPRTGQFNTLCGTGSKVTRSKNNTKHISVLTAVFVLFFVFF